jgi:hypothetical protein
MLPFRVSTQLPVRRSPSADRSIPTSPSKRHSPELITHALSPNRAKRDPFVSITCTLFSIHNIAHPLCFVAPAHSLAKTPGGSIGISNQISSIRTVSEQILEFPLNPTESYSFANRVGVGCRNSLLSFVAAASTVNDHERINSSRRNTGGSAEKNERPSTHANKNFRRERTHSPRSARRLKRSKAILSGCELFISVAG